jgi:hypothetical protein
MNAGLHLELRDTDDPPQPLKTSFDDSGHTEHSVWRSDNMLKTSFDDSGHTEQEERSTRLLRAQNACPNLSTDLQWYLVGNTSLFNQH